MKKDRTLIVILIGIGALVVLSLVLFFTRPASHAYRTGSTPDAVAYNYILAIMNKDYERAYTYLADLPNKPAYTDFRQVFLTGSANPDNSGADIGQVSISGDQAVVILTIYYGYNDPFSSRTGMEDRAILVNQGGAWKLSSMPSGNFWNYDWYQNFNQKQP